MKWQLFLGLAAMTVLGAQAPDNTKTNRDAGMTATDQKMDKKDRDLAKKIRHSVYEDKSLSTYAHNVKIIVADGHVTLKGPVKSQTEKDAVQKAAVDIAGATNVDNQIEIAPEKN